MKRLFFGLILRLALMLAVFTPDCTKAIVYNGPSGRFRDWSDLGCRMSPGGAGAPASGAENAGGNQAYCEACQEGLSRWWIDSPYLNLFISDEPLSYFTSSGEKMRFRFLYKQRYKLPDSDVCQNLYTYNINWSRYSFAHHSNPYQAFMRTYGMTNACWSHNWMMEVLCWNTDWENIANIYTQWFTPVFSSGYEALLFRPEGGIQYYHQIGTNIVNAPNDPLSQVQLQPLSNLGYVVMSTNGPSTNADGTAWGDAGTGFKLLYPDGSMDIFSLTPFEFGTDGSSPYGNPVLSNSTAHAFLTQRIDPAGRITRLGYEQAAYTNWYDNSDPYSPKDKEYLAWRIRYLVDSDGRTNRFIYNSSTNVSGTPPAPYSAWELLEIDDPYGRKAQFSYSAGVLSSITDAMSNSSSFAYQGTNGWITNLTTPYGPTSFTFYQLPDTNAPVPSSFFSERAAYVSEPQGAQQLYCYLHQDTLLSATATPPTVAGQTTFDDGTATNSGVGALTYRNTLHWDRRQFTALSSGVTGQLPGNLSTAVANLTTNDLKKGYLKHWLLSSADSESITESLSSQRDPSPDSGGLTEGPRTWYNYGSKQSGFPEEDGYPQVGCIAQILPDSSSQYIRYNYFSNYVSPQAGWVQENDSSYTLNSTNAELKTWFGYAANGIDLTTITDSFGQSFTFVFNTNHQITFGTNSLNYVTSLSYASNHNLTGVTLPSGQSVSIGLNSTGQVQNITLRPQNRVMGISNYLAGLPSVIHATGTGLPDLWLTNTWDGLNRLVNTAFTDNTSVSNLYTFLDLTGHKDRLTHWTWFAYDGLEHLQSITDPRSNVTYLSWCDCGALTSVADPLNNTNMLFYNNQELLTGLSVADGSSVSNSYDNIGRIVSTKDGAGRALSFGYNNQGLITTVSNASGRVLQAVYDGLSRPTNLTDANGVSVTNQFDLLNRVTARTWQDNISESFVYSSKGLIAYTNRDGKWTLFTRDPRIIGITNANGEVVALTNNALDEITDLWDGRGNHTTWQYNQYGWLMSKTNALPRAAFVYTRDPNGQVTNRWTPQFGNTAYAFDPAGNLTNMVYIGSPSTHSVAFGYDALNRLQTMVDGAGTNAFTYTAASQLQTEDGPWVSDTVTNTYAQQLRQTLSMSQPSSGAWSQTYGYDSAWRLTSLVSPAGVFAYGYPANASALVRTIGLPNGASETNHYDSLSRLDFTALVDHWGHILDGYGYIHDPLGLRTNISRYLGMTTNFVAAGYDNIGQITSWSASETNAGALVVRQNEQWSWAYDKSGNVQVRNNGSLVQTLTNDSANELTGISRNSTLTVSGATPAPATNITVNGQSAWIYGDMTFAATNQNPASAAFTNVAQNMYGAKATNIIGVALPASVMVQFDLNGNLSNDGTRTFVYDAENRLVTNSVSGTWKSEFVYDGLGRRRIERDYTWQGGWGTPSELHFIYDGWLLIQIRDGNNNVLVTFTRGLDFSGSIAGAGGIGGLLARTDGNGSAYYHADGSGNVTALIDSYQIMQARYEYSPFGRLVGKWGAFADVNEMQFSSMPVHRLSGLSTFTFRDGYDPALQRWIQADPIGEVAGVNLYQFVANSPVSQIDIFGLSWWRPYGDSGPNRLQLWSGLWSQPTWMDAGGNVYHNLPPTDRLNADIPDDITDIENVRLYSNNLNGDTGGALTKEVGLEIVKGVAKTAMALPWGEEESLYRAADKLNKLRRCTTRALFETPKGELFTKVIGLAERVRTGHAEEVTQDLFQLAQTEAGREQLLELHQAVSQLIPYAENGEPASILIGLQWITGYLARGGK